ncbi:hypothetical protein BDZ91DRAFT_751557, partial [Kalaharituber pfeilii]
ISAQERLSTLPLTWSDLSSTTQELAREYVLQHLRPKPFSASSTHDDDDQDDNNLGGTYSSLVLSHTDLANVFKRKQRQDCLPEMSRTSKIRRS